MPAELEQILVGGQTMSALPPIKRPDGRMYRPHRITVIRLDNDPTCNQDPWTIVLGTHDPDFAYQVADGRGGTCDHLAANPSLEWRRLGWEAGERAWIDDPARGAACVIFTETEDPDEAYKPGVNP